MALTTVGTVYKWGISGTTVTNGEVQSLSLSEEYTTNVEVKDGNGNVVGMRLDNPETTGTCTFLYSAQDYGLEAGETQTLSVTDLGGTTQTFRITGVSESHSNESYKEATLTIEYIPAID
jgi:hypothetical protein